MRGVMVLFAVMFAACSAQTGLASLPQEKEKRLQEKEEVSFLIVYPSQELIQKAKKRRADYLKKHKSFPKF